MKYFHTNFLIIEIALTLVAIIISINPKDLLSQEIEKNSFLGVAVRGDKMFGDWGLKEGAGVTLFGGYRFNEIFTMQLEILLPSKHDTGDYVVYLTDGYTYRFFTNLGFGGVVFNMKFHSQTSTSAKPFFLLGLGSYSLMDSSEGFSGLGYQGGFGFDFLSPSWITELCLKYCFVNYNRATLGGQTGKLSTINENTLSLNLGIGYRF